MAQKNIDFGAFPDDPDADAIRTAFQKVQENFTEVYTGVQGASVASVNRTPGAGITVNSPTGNVVITANIACVKVHSSTLWVGRDSNGYPTGTYDAIITSGSQTLWVDLPTSIANVTDINLDGNLNAVGNVIAENITSNASLTVGGTATVNQLNAGNLSATGNVISGNLTAGGNLSVTGNSTLGNISSTGNISGANLNINNVNVSYTLTTTGNSTVGNLNTSGNVSAIGDIIGGNLTTSGNLSVTSNATIGNLSVTGSLQAGSIGISGIINGTSNINIPSLNSNITMGINGNSNVFVASDLGIEVTGYLSATGNSNTGNVNTTGVYATTLSSTGNANVGNLGTTGVYATTLSSTGNANVGNLGTTGVYATTLSSTGNANVGNINTIGVYATTLSATGNSNTGNVNTTGVYATTLSSTGNANVGNLGTSGLITATGNITGGNLVTGGNLSAAGLLVTGTANLGNVGNVKIIGGTPYTFLSTDGAGNLSWTSTANSPPGGSNTSIQYNDAGAYNGDNNLTWNKVDSNLTVNGNILASALSATTISGSLLTNAQPNITSTGSLSTLTVVGGVLIQGSSIFQNSINGTQLTLNNNLWANGNTYFSNISNLHISGGTSGQVLTTDGSNNLSWTTISTATSFISNGTSNVSVSTINGNVTTSVAGNANIIVVTGTGANISGTLSVSGNSNTGNVNTTGVYATTLSSTGNANVGNLGSTGNITGGNLITSGLVNTGTLTVTGTSNLGAIGNVRITGGSNGQYLQTNGSGNLSWASISTSSISNGNSNVTIPAANGSVSVWATGNLVLLTTGVGVEITGTLSASGNANVGNIGTTTVTLIGAGGAGNAVLQPTVTTPGSLATLTLPGSNDTLVGKATYDTLTNKIIQPRVSNTASITTPLSLNSSNFDQYNTTAQATGFTISADAGSPVDGQKLVFRILDNGTSRTITFTGGVSNGFRPVGVTLTASGSNYTYATTANKTVYFGCIYNASVSRWDIIGLSLES